MKVIVFLNFAISLIFTLCYFYQFVYVFVGLFKKSKSFTAEKNHRYAVVISARNEGNVIGNLINSIQKQTYPSDLLDIFVVADNCTDDTAEVARRAGATVYERFNHGWDTASTRQCYLFAASLPPHSATEQVSLKKTVHHCPPCVRVEIRH